MVHDSSATPREETSDTLNETSQEIDASLKRRARTLTTNSSIPQRTRNLIRYALEGRDPFLAQLVRRIEAGEMTIDHVQIE